LRLFAIIPTAFLGLVAALVSVRLLALALRTRQLPELALGFGLTCIGILGLLLATAGRMPAVTSNVAIITWYLSFLPPERYLRWVRNRAAADRVARQCA